MTVTEYTVPLKILQLAEFEVFLIFRVIWLNLPGNIITVTMTILVGLIIYANYSTCDPIKTKQVSSPNQVIIFLLLFSKSKFL